MAVSGKAFTYQRALRTSRAEERRVVPLRV